MESQWWEQTSLIWSILSKRYLRAVIQEYLGQLSWLSNFCEMPLSIVIKFHEGEMKTVWLRAQISLIRQNFGRFNGHNSEVPRAIYLVIDLGQNSVPLSTVTKFYDLTKTDWLTDLSDITNLVKFWILYGPQFRSAWCNWTRYLGQYYYAF